VTTVSSVDTTTLRALPTRLRPGSPPVAYDITTSATYSGTIDVCLQYQAGSVPSTGNLFLLHYSSSAWADVTTSVDRGTGTVCGEVSSLSPFVVASDSITESSATSDPHLIGASGEAYEFDGEPDGIYNLFSAPQFQVAMYMAGDGPGTHFMTQLGLLFKGERFLFGESTMTEAVRADLEDRLTRVGGSLLEEWSSYHATLGLCPGHTVGITQIHTTDYWLMHADGSPYNYYDVHVVVHGCHDAYDDALGQTYECKYVEGHDIWAWSHDQEETFRLASLFTASSLYSAEALCGGPLTGASLSGTSTR